MCLAQGHNAVTPVRLKPTALGLESSILPLSHCTPKYIYIKKKHTINSVECISPSNTPSPQILFSCKLTPMNAGFPVSGIFLGLIWDQTTTPSQFKNKSAAGMQHTPSGDIFNAKKIILKKKMFSSKPRPFHAKFEENW